MAFKNEFEHLCFYNICASLSSRYVYSFLNNIGDDIKHFAIYEESLKALNADTLPFKINLSYRDSFLEKILDYKNRVELNKTYRKRRIRARRRGDARRPHHKRAKNRTGHRRVPDESVVVQRRGA